MDSFFPIIIIIIISVVSSLIKKANEQKNSEQKKVTHYDKNGRPIKTVIQPTESRGGLADILKEFQKLKETVETASRPQHGFPTPRVKTNQANSQKRFPDPIEIPLEIDHEDEVQEFEPVNGSVSMQDRIAVRENALAEFVDENHPIFKGAGKAAESLISNKQQGKFMSEFGQKNNLLRAIIMNEVISPRKG